MTSADAPTATELANQTATLAKQHYAYAVTNVRQFVEDRSLSFWIVLGIVLVSIGGWLLYRWYVTRRWRLRYVDCAGCYLRFRDTIASVNEKEPIPARRLTRSRGGFSYSMWLYVAKWYGDSSGKWKNLYYRGDQVDPSACTLQWDSLPRQNPGIWLSDDQNNLRVVVGTKVVMPETTKDCLVKEQGERHGGMAGALDGAFTPVKETQKKGGGDADETCAPASIVKPLTSMDLLEYADIRDFPIGRWFHLVVVVTPQRIELYLDGKLVKTSVFVGVYEDDCTKRGFFSVGHPMTGRLANFRFMPHPLPYQMIKYLYTNEGRRPFLAQPDPMRDDDNRYG